MSFEDAPQRFQDFEDFSEAPAGSAPPAGTAGTPRAFPSPRIDEFTLDESVEEPAVPSGTGTGEFEEFLAEADFYFQQGLVDEAEFLYSKLLRLAPGHPVVTAQLSKLEGLRPPAPAVNVSADIGSIDDELDAAFGGELPAQSVKPPAPGADGSDFADFLVGLQQEVEIPPAPPSQTAEEGLNEIFQEFQRSVKEQLGDEDFETHYNLGIAYKEMGLMDEAVAEFTLAEKSPVRRLNAVSMIALCLREMGRFDEAALRLRTGISLAVEGSEDQKGFLYDLAALHEQAGRAAEAQEALRRLLAIDPGYRDVAARTGAAPPPAAGPPRKKSKVSYL